MRKSVFAFIGIFAIGLAVTTLTSCGGGGGSDTSAAPGTNPPPPPPPPPPPSTQFVDITGESGILFRVEFSPGIHPEISSIAGGVGAGDYDNDGDVDLFIVTGGVGPNLLYHNMGNNTFVDVATAAGVAYTRSPTENYRHSGPTFADMDGDGDLDLFLGGVQGDPSLIFVNNGDDTFSDVTAGSGIDTLTATQNISAALGDYDLDGDLDLFVSHWSTARNHDSPGDTEHLWRNDSNTDGIRFTSVSVLADISSRIFSASDPLATRRGADHTFSPTFARINDDLHPDILSVADFNFSQVFINNQDDTFNNVTDYDVIIDANGMGSALGDYDNDGDLDWFVSSIYASDTPGPNGEELIGNRLYSNDGNGVFSDVTEQTGVADGGWGWGSCFVDLENDGDLDIYHTNGWRRTNFAGDFTMDTSRAFISDGNGSFTESASALGLDDTEQGRGVVCADFDNDGDVDIFLWHQNQRNSGTLYRNDVTENNYLSVKLNGLSPNTEAAGARIKATIGGTTQMREIIIGSNFISQNPTTQIIGLGTSSQVDELVIEWPDGKVFNMGAVQAGQLTGSESS